MFLSNASIKRPVAMACLLIGLTLLGLNAYRKMGLELMPKVDVPYITISTVYPGASPVDIETDIAKTIEDEVVSIEGLKHVSSTCMENVCLTFMEFQIDVDVDIAATDVREKVDLIRSEFPDGVEDPKILKYDINAKPIITLALTGTAPLDDLYDYADNTLSDTISVMKGVASVDIIGGAEREVNVLLDREKLAARGLTSYTVMQVISAATGTIPTGRIRSAGMEYSVKFDAEHAAIEDVGDIPLVSFNGQRCLVRDIADVVMSTEELRQLSELDGRPAIALKIVKKSDANAVAVVRQVRSVMDDLRSNLPGGMELVWFTDDGAFTEATNSSAWINVAQGVLLTAAVLFLFLYNFRSLFVVALSMPLTIVIGLFFMQAMDFTLNVSTLIAVGMSVGILVTNSIVVLEAIVKHLGRTGDPVEAAKRGAAESFIAVLASAGTNIVVLFPLSVLGGMIGLFIKPFALTMLIMTGVSLFISFTLTPLLCAIVLKPNQRQNAFIHRLERGWNRGFNRLTAGYRRYLTYVSRRRGAGVAVLGAVVSLVFVSLVVGGSLGTSMASEADRGELIVKLEFPTSYSLNATVHRTREAIGMLQDLPEIKSQLTTVGKVEGMVGQSSEGVHLAQVMLKFSEKTDRSESIEDLAQRVRELLYNFTDAIITVNMPSVIGGSSSDVELEIRGPELDQLDMYACNASMMTEKIDGFKDIDTSVRDGKPEIRILPNRSILADINVPPMALGMSLRGNVEGLEAGTFKQAGRNYDIIVKYKEQEGEDQIEAFMMPDNMGRPVNLKGFGDIQHSVAPVQIIRKDKKRMSKMFANLEDSLPLGTAASLISEGLDRDGELLPGYSHGFGGIYESMTEGQNELIEATLISLVLVVLTLAGILESFKQPILILITLPLTIIGVVWALFAGGYSISIFVLMGIVMLIGIVVNNAILILDKFNILIAEGVSSHQAMIDASAERLRPVLMITIAAVLGMLPMAFGQGLGAEMRNDIGLASALGILVSGILTLLTMPVVYTLFTRDKRSSSQ